MLLCISVYYSLNGSNQSGAGIQPTLLMDSPSSISSSSSSTNIPYQSCATLDSGNSILRAALQKSTATSPPGSTNSNPSTPITLNQSVNNGLSFSDLNSHAYNSNRHNLYNVPGSTALATAAYQSAMPFNSYNSNSYQYQNSFNSDSNKQQLFNQVTYFLFLLP